MTEEQNPLVRIAVALETIAALMKECSKPVCALAEGDVLPEVITAVQLSLID